MTNDRERKLRKIITDISGWSEDSQATNDLISAILELDNPYKEALKKIIDDMDSENKENRCKYCYGIVKQALDQTGKCLECKGTGVTPDEKPYEGTCPQCNGTGRSQTEKCKHEWVGNAIYITHCKLCGMKCRMKEIY